jgi:hypothetical protein
VYREAQKALDSESELVVTSLRRTIRQLENRLEKQRLDDNEKTREIMRLRHLLREHGISYRDKENGPDVL